MVKRYNFKGYATLLSRRGLKEYRRHMRTNITKARTISPNTVNSFEISFIDSEVSRNPWYAYRNYLSNEGRDKIREHEYTALQCIFNGVNTWIQHDSDRIENFRAVVKAALVLTMLRPKQSSIIFTEDSKTASRVKAMYEEELARIHPAIQYQIRPGDVLITSSHQEQSTSLVDSYDNVIVLDVTKHKKVSRLFDLIQSRKNNRFIFTSSKMGNEVSPAEVEVLKFHRDRCLEWDDSLYEHSSNKFKHATGRDFILHRYLY